LKVVLELLLIELIRRLHLLQLLLQDLHTATRRSALQVQSGMLGLPVALRQAPLYLADDSHLVSDSIRRSLQSADVSTSVVPRTLSSYGDRTFAAAGPHLWNSLFQSSWIIPTLPTDCFNDS